MSEYSKGAMVKSYQFIRPEGIPFQLLNFEFYFENENSRYINIVHSSGMHLIYYVSKVCYQFPENVFYELLILQNKQIFHEPKYDWLVMKGFFSSPGITVDLSVENSQEFQNQKPSVMFFPFFLSRMPEPGNEIVIRDGGILSRFYHFSILNIFAGIRPRILLSYLETCGGIDPVLDRWVPQKS